MTKRRSSERGRPRPSTIQATERVKTNMTHLPSHSWCRHDIMGKGREEGCRLSQSECWRKTSPGDIHLDCMFMREGRVRTFVQRRLTGEWICRRWLAWLRGIGFEFVDIIVKSDNEAALTSLIETWSVMRAMRGGLRIIVENSSVGSLTSNGIIEKAIQSVQGMIRTIRSDIEEK